MTGTVGSESWAWAAVASPALALLGAPPTAEAFCGFYVAGADAQLYNNATMVVMMRDGTRTVLSMQNNYQGPPENFAMVVPVPVVLGEDDVKTLEREVFDRVDQLAAPRLVEYWEQDPCYEPPQYKYKGADATAARRAMAMAMPAAAERQGLRRHDRGRSSRSASTRSWCSAAKDSTGLDTWLRDNGYKIPDGAAPVLRALCRRRA